MRLDFLTVNGDYLTVQPPGVRLGAFEVPVSGISLGGQMYVVVSTDHSMDRTTDRSVLTKYTPPAAFKPLRTISKLPAGRFIKMSMHAEPGPMAANSPLTTHSQKSIFWSADSTCLGLTQQPNL